MLTFDQRGLLVMSLVRVHNFSVSLDGFGTGADQSLEAPFGHAGHRLVRWFAETRSFHVMTGQPGGSTGIDDAFASNWGPGIGAEIMGRNKFGPQRGPWTDEEWQGWGGGEAPLRPPLFLVPPPPRPPVPRRRRGRPHARGARAGAPRPRRASLGRPGGPRGAVRDRVGERA